MQRLDFSLSPTTENISKSDDLKISQSPMTENFSKSSDWKIRLSRKLENLAKSETENSSKCRIEIAKISNTFPHRGLLPPLKKRDWGIRKIPTAPFFCGAKLPEW